jgi:hypothetical protein
MCDLKDVGDDLDGLIEVPVDQFTLSPFAIQAVLDGKGPGLCELAIDILTAIAVASGAVVCTPNGLRSAPGWLAQLAWAGSTP